MERTIKIREQLGTVEALTMDEADRLERVVVGLLRIAVGDDPNGTRSGNAYADAKNEVQRKRLQGRAAGLLLRMADEYDRRPTQTTRRIWAKA